MAASIHAGAPVRPSSTRLRAEPDTSRTLPGDDASASVPRATSVGAVSEAKGGEAGPTAPEALDIPTLTLAEVVERALMLLWNVWGDDESGYGEAVDVARVAEDGSWVWKRAYRDLKSDPDTGPIVATRELWSMRVGVGGHGGDEASGTGTTATDQWCMMCTQQPAAPAEGPVEGGSTDTSTGSGATTTLLRLTPTTAQLAACQHFLFKEVRSALALPKAELERHPRPLLMWVLKRAQQSDEGGPGAETAAWFRFLMCVATTSPGVVAVVFDQPRSWCDDTFVIVYLNVDTGHMGLGYYEPGFVESSDGRTELGEAWLADAVAVDRDDGRT